MGSTSSVGIKVVKDGGSGKEGFDDPAGFVGNKVLPGKDVVGFNVKAAAVGFRVEPTS